MGDWNFLGGILEEVHIHSTMVGKIWLTILFIFRMLVLGVAAEDVWNDEQADFVCNTEQPGCRNVCYDLAFPISLIRYWVLQVIFVSSPSLVYMGHALYRLRALEKVRQRKKALLRKELELVDLELAESRRRIEREMKSLDQRKVNKAPLSGSLLRTYVAHIVTRSVVEVAFMTGQYLLYGFHLNPLFRCERDPCPNAVDCYVSRPTEKSVFMVFMQCIAAISLFLNVLEILHLGYKNIKKAILDLYPHLSDEKDELNEYLAQKYKKESVWQVYTGGARKATLASKASDYNLLMDRVQNTVTFPDPVESFPSVPGEQTLHQDSDDLRASSQSPPGQNGGFPDHQACSTRCDSFAPKHRGEDASQESVDRGVPVSPKWPLKTKNVATLPTLSENVQKTWMVQESKLLTVTEGKNCSSSGGPSSTCVWSKSNEKHGNRTCSPEESSSGSNAASCRCKTTVSSSTSSRRAPDLKI
ncbi:gap junction alpha-9 protein [Cynoglossus semilaevis]|nr:gap junction alpha-9 protein [Cynoglossus semilaevis]